MTATARSHIEALLVELWYDIDHHGGRSAHTMFTEKARLSFDARTFAGRDQIQQVYRDRAARGTRTSRHVVTNVRVAAGADDRAEVVSAVLLFAADGAPPIASTSPVCVADVHDVVVREAGTWRIEKRRWQSIFIAPDAVLAVPTR